MCETVCEMVCVRQCVCDTVCETVCDTDQHGQKQYSSTPSSTVLLYVQSF